MSLVRNRMAEALPASITPEQLGQAMAQLDLSAIPPEKRQAAVIDHLLRVMGDTIQDRQYATVIHAARIVRDHVRPRPNPWGVNDPMPQRDRGE